mmetsp:Transcript_21499/g.46029  ORF Transcript_21499/g.46029 Transcript_21499/m.46029 type:complete len:853 (-) Transcript_21499:309-2867(-)
MGWPTTSSGMMRTTNTMPSIEEQASVDIESEFPSTQDSLGSDDQEGHVRRVWRFRKQADTTGQSAGVLGKMSNSLGTKMGSGTSASGSMGSYGSSFSSFWSQSSAMTWNTQVAEQASIVVQPSQSIIVDDSGKHHLGSERVATGFWAALYVHWRRYIKVFFTAFILALHFYMQTWIWHAGSQGKEVFLHPGDEFILAASISLNLPLICWLVFEWVRTESSFAARQAGWLFLFCWFHSALSAISKIRMDWPWMFPVLGISEQGKYGMTVIAIWWRVSMAEDAFLTEGNEQTRRQGCSNCMLILLVAALPVPAARVYFWLEQNSIDHVTIVTFALGVIDMVYKLLSFVVMGFLAWQTFSRIYRPLQNSPHVLKDKKYLLSEVLWAQHVVRRVRLAVVLLCFAGVVQHAFWLMFVIKSEFEDADPRSWIMFYDVPTNIYIAFDFFTLLMIVGCFHSQNPNTGPGLARPQEPADRQSSEGTESEAWEKTVQKLGQRYITAWELLVFYQELRSSEVLPHFDPDTHTMNDIVRAVVIPQSRLGDRGFAYADLLAERRKEAKQKESEERLNSGAAPLEGGAEGILYAQRMVTHDWRNQFVNTVSAVLADALSQREYGPIVRELRSDAGVERMIKRLEKRGSQNMRYWICAFCVNQHLGICGGFPLEPDRDSPEYPRYKANALDSVTGERHGCCGCLEPKFWSGDNCEMDKFDGLMKLLSQEVPELKQVVAIDRNFDLFSRVWCVAELVEAHRSQIEQNVCLLWKRSLDANTGDVGTYLKLAMVSVNDCSAARENDKDRILHKIRTTCGIPEFDAHLQATIFGDGGLLGKELVGFDVIYAAARAAMRVQVAAKQAGVTGV